MKRKYIYLLVPLAGVILFSFFYIPFANRYEAKNAEMRKAEADVRQAKLLAQQEAQRTAIIKANEDAERRRKEREEKKARLEAEQKAREEAIAQERKIFNDQQKYKDKVDSLQSESRQEQAAIAKLQDEKQQALKEIEFLKTDVRMAQDNVRNIASLVSKLTEAEAARAKAEAEAKKANNS